MELPQDWKLVLEAEIEKEYFKKLIASTDQAYQSTTVFPPKEAVFKALALCSLEATRVVILGQDPYHGPNQAHGLSFSVLDGVTLPPSLRNIYKERNSDLGKGISDNGNLEHWATQGVLLLNATLTVEAGKPGSHQKLGWERFTDAVIQTVSDEKEHVVFILWGNFARSKKTLIDTDKHLVLEAPHPSPLSAYTGFFGSRPFSQTNAYLAEHDIPTVDW